MEKRNTRILVNFSNDEINFFKNEIKLIKEKVENQLWAITHDMYFRNGINFLSKNDDDIEYYIYKVKDTENSPIEYSFIVVNLRSLNIPEHRFDTKEELINWMKNEHFI